MEALGDIMELTGINFLKRYMEVHKYENIIKACHSGLSGIITRKIPDALRLRE